MTRGLCFWVIMLLWFVLGLAWHGGLIVGYFGPIGFSLLLFLLLALLGWQTFGPPLKG